MVLYSFHMIKNHVRGQLVTIINTGVTKTQTSRSSAHSNLSLRHKNICLKAISINLQTTKSICFFTILQCFIFTTVRHRKTY